MNGLTVPSVIAGLSDDAQKKCEELVRLVGLWNRRMRLVSDANPQVVIDRHIADSLAALPECFGAKSIVDLGSGPGFPGIPLAIALPETQVVLVESLHKRCSFSSEVRRQLGLDNLRVVCGRVEDCQVVDEAGQADCVVSRATWDMASYLDYASRYVVSGGDVLAWKRTLDKVELGGAERKITELGWGSITMRHYETPGLEHPYTVIKIKTA